MTESRKNRRDVQNGGTAQQEIRLTRTEERMLIVAVMLGTFLPVFNISNINIALPSLVDSLHTDITTAQGLVIGYMLANCLIMPAVGYYTDKFSGRNMFLLGLALLGVSSLACALAPTIEVMILARVLQGLAGGILMPVPPALIYPFIPPERQLMSISLVSMVSSLGVAVAPSLAGVLIQYLGWQAIFLVNLPLVLLDLVLVIRFVPYQAFDSDAKLDYLGLVCAVLGTVGLLIGFDQGGALGWTSPATLLLLGGSAAILTFFVWHELHVPQPLLKFSVFRYAGFSVSFVLNTMLAVAICCGAIYMSIFLQDVLGLNAMQAGLVMFVPAMMMALMAPVAAKLEERFGLRPVVLAALLILCLSAWQQSRFLTTTTVLVFSIWVGLRYIGIGLANPLINNFAMSSVPVRLVSHASAMFNWTRQVFQTIGVSVFALIYSNRVSAYLAQGMAAEAGAEQMRFIECQAVDDIFFYTLLFALACLPLVYFLKDTLRSKKAS